MRRRYTSYSMMRIGSNEVRREQRGGTDMPRTTLYRVGYMLVVTGLAISVALHVVSFWVPGLADYGPWIALSYAVLVIFRNLTAWRRPSAWLPRAPGAAGPPGARPAP